MNAPSERDLNKLRKLLFRRRRELSDLVCRLRHDLSMLHSPNSSERAIECENDEVLGSLEKEACEELDAVANALTRFTTGSYGSCEVCGEEIRLKRLYAQPTANHCIRCAVRAEKNQNDSYNSLH